MDIQGFHVVSVPDTESPDGLSSTVTAKDGTIRGPFKTIKEAIDCAQAWAIEASLPGSKVAVSLASIITASESIAVHVDQPFANPAIVDSQAETD